MTEIPGYKIRRELGHGGMATVYLATQESLERAVALKVMAPALASDRTFTQRFIKEGKTIAKFNHANIVGVYDVGVSERHHYIAMEHVKGGDLKRRLKKHGAVDPSEALSILKDVAEALAYAHMQGFVHRDVKSENILFREDGTAVLTDFGIAKAADSGTRMTGTGMSIGTPHYMSPEQARGKPVDGRSDIYSLGVVFFEMLTGKVPFEAEDSVAIGIMHVSQPVPALPASLSSYKALCNRLLAKDPKERYQTAEELIQAVEVLQRATHPGSGEETVGASKPRRVGVLTLGGLTVAVALAAAAHLMDWGLELPFLRQTITNGQAPVSPQPGSATSDPIPATDRAILKIASNPVGAEVLLDGKKLGVTPFLSDRLPPGKHDLALRHKYFKPFSEALELVNDTVVKRDLSLSRAAGTVTVLSDPPNARVVFNGERQSDRTPLTLNKVPAGVHTLTLELDRYFNRTLKIEVLPNETVRQRVVLEGGDLVQAGNEWVRPADAAETFVELARRAARQGDVKRTGEYLAKARTYAAKGMPFGALEGLIDIARAKERKLRDAHARAKTARELAEVAVAAYDRAEAVRQYRVALQAYPDDPEAKAGLERAEALRSAGETFRDRLRDGTYGPEMVVIGPGTYTMGSDEGVTGRSKDEGPPHQLSITKPFALGKYEVTFEDYDRFAEATGRPKPRDRGWGRGRRPVINVSWTDSQAYVKWLSQLTGERYRLPSEAEWEFAARAGSETVYWWGKRLKTGKANCDGCGSAWDEKKTLPVGSYKPNLFGLYDTAGNVFEWTEDCLNNDYESAPTDGSAWLTGNCSRRIYRGGSWYYGPRFVRSANRAENTQSYRSSNVGFRVAREINWGTLAQAN